LKHVYVSDVFKDTYTVRMWYVCHIVEVDDLKSYILIVYTVFHHIIHAYPQNFVVRNLVA